MLKLKLGVVAAALFGVAALAPSASAQAANGAKIYATNCSQCHQMGGTGVQGIFPPLLGSEWVTGSEERLVRVLLHGLTGEITVRGEEYAGTMSPFGGVLKDAEIAAVSTYIRSNFTNKAPPVSTATVARIRKETAARKKPWTAKELAAFASTPAKK